jgi:hypothetical protein
LVAPAFAAVAALRWCVSRLPPQPQTFEETAQFIEGSWAWAAVFCRTDSISPTRDFHIRMKPS